MTTQPDQPSIPQWNLAPDAWRWVGRFDERHARSLLRLRSAKVMPSSMRARFLAMGIPADILESTLASIRSPKDWSNAWIETAQRFLGDYRRQQSARHLLDASRARRLAALSYHSAQLFALDDQRTVRTCRAAAAALFAQAQPFVYPKAQRVTIPWRNHRLYGYFQPPTERPGHVGLVVLLSGTSTSKEESFGWADAFLRSGLGVLAIDSPGTGEATNVPNPNHDEEDLLDGVFDVLRQFRNIDLRQVSIVGMSLGGNLAIRCAVYDRRIMAVVAVTPPYDPGRWIHRTSPILRTHFAGTFDRDADIDTAAAHYSLYDVVPNLRSPLLVFGAGHDLVVPPTDAQLLTARAGALGSLIWYGGSGHCLYDAIPSWTVEAATWISSVAAARATEYQTAGHADPVHIAEIARDQLMSAHLEDDDLFEDEGGAWLVETEDTDADTDSTGSFARMITLPVRHDSPDNHAT